MTGTTRPYFGEIYVAVALDRQPGSAALAMLAVREGDGRSRMVLDQHAGPITANQAVAHALLRAVDRLEQHGLRAALLTNLQAAVFGDDRDGEPEGDDFRGLINRLARRCRETGCEVRWCASAHDPMPRVRQAATDHLAALATTRRPA